MQVKGIESHLNPVAVDESFHFLNPKAGISYDTKAGTVYASYSIAHREPIRDDYIDALPGEKPKPESMGNLELGIRKSTARFQYAVNYFLMNYVNQLVLTGELNDDGAYIRKNAGKSYRTGIELSGGFKVSSFMELSGNLAVSINKTDYRQTVHEDSMVLHENTPISFSPPIIGGAQIKVFPVKNLEINWVLKYVSKQYLDNTGNNRPGS